MVNVWLLYTSALCLAPWERHSQDLNDFRRRCFPPPEISCFLHDARMEQHVILRNLFILPISSGTKQRCLLHLKQFFIRYLNQFFSSVIRKFIHFCQSLFSSPALGKSNHITKDMTMGLRFFRLYWYSAEVVLVTRPKHILAAAYQLSLSRHTVRHVAEQKFY